MSRSMVAQWGSVLAKRVSLCTETNRWYVSYGILMVFRDCCSADIATVRRRRKPRIGPHQWRLTSTMREDVVHAPSPYCIHSSYINMSGIICIECKLPCASGANGAGVAPELLPSCRGRYHKYECSANLDRESARNSGLRAGVTRENVTPCAPAPPTHRKKTDGG